jgi:hypothetical protein
MARVSSKPEKAGRNSQCVIHHGTNPLILGFAGIGLVGYRQRQKFAGTVSV